MTDSNTILFLTGIKRGSQLAIGKKLILYFFGLWLVGACLLVGLTFIQSRNALLENIKIRALDYATLGALAVSVEEHASLISEDDMETVEYEHVVAALRKVRAGNNQIRYVYTFRKNVDGDLIFIADAEENEDEKSILGDVYEDATPVLLKAIEGSSAAVVEDDFSTDEWGTSISAYAPLITKEGGFDGLIGVDISLESVNKKLFEILLPLLISSVIISALIALVSILFSRAFVKAIKSCVDFSTFLAKGDFSKDVPNTILTRHDEIGLLAQSIQTVTSNTRELLCSLKERSESLFSTGVLLSTNMFETASSANQIAGGIQKVKEQFVHQTESVGKTNDAVLEITQNIKVLDDSIEKQAINIEQSSLAIENMLKNISLITQNLLKNSKNVEDLTSDSEQGREDLKTVAFKIREVAKESESLLEISSVIEDIASQTNLLSMNAAIEAAHAGSAGKGFSVVADQIRKLAESSGNSAKTVSHVLSRIKVSMEEISRATDVVMAQFEDIDKEIISVVEHELAIKDAMNEQDKGVSQILASSSLLKNITTTVKNGSSVMLTESSGILNEGTILSLITQEVNKSMREMADGLEHITKSMNKMSHISAENKESIESVIHSVDRFILK